MDGPCLLCHSLHVIQLGYSGYCLLCGLTCLTACVAFRRGNYEITQSIKRSVVTLKNIFSFKAEQSHFHSYHQFMISDCGRVKLLRSITYKCQLREALFYKSNSSIISKPLVTSPRVINTGF